MKTYEKRWRPAKEETYLVSITCDLCDTRHVREWKQQPYDATETVVRMKTGKNYPDNGYGEETTIDICPDCFENKLIPWVKSQGGEPTVKEWEW